LEGPTSKVKRGRAGKEGMAQEGRAGAGKKGN